MPCPFFYYDFVSPNLRQISLREGGVNEVPPHREMINIAYFFFHINVAMKDSHDLVLAKENVIPSNMEQIKYSHVFPSSSKSIRK